MIATADPRPARRRVWQWARRYGLGLAAGLVVIALGVVGLRLFDGVSALRSAPHDNLQWSLAQIEVDLLQLTNAADVFDHPEQGLGEFRRRFDIFYSRMNTVSSGAVFAELRDIDSIGAILARINGFLAETVPLVDGDDRMLRAVGDRVRADIEALRDPVRRLSLEGVRLFAKLSDSQRIAFEALLLTASLVAAALIVILAVASAVLTRQYRISIQRLQELQRNRERLAATINSALDAIIVSDENGRLIEMNRAAEEVFGYSRADAVGRDMAEMIIPPRYREAHRAGMARLRATGEKRVVDQGRVNLDALHADGSEFPVELSIGSATGQSGPIFIAFIRDISERLQAERALTDARDQAMAADRAKSEFIAVMSHEMRTPLNGLLGVLDLLGRTRLAEEQAEYLQVATTSGEILLRNVNDVLDIARMESGKLTFDVRPFDLAGTIRRVADVNRPLAAASGVPIHVDIGPVDHLLGDVHRIQQIAMNLIGNAVKFTRSGEIRVALQTLSAAAGFTRLRLTVTDTGIGIAAADQKRIFEDFVTLDASYAREAAGSGLGLAICRRIVDALDGTISVCSEPGRGSCFTMEITLPNAGAGKTGEGASPRPLADAAAQSRSLDVLVVEDNAINRFVVREMITEAGHRVDEACDGLEGVTMAGHRAYDLVLMDISMPGMTGIEATVAIRASQGPSCNAPIFGLTAHARPEEQARFAEAGMQACLTKPIRMERLTRMIADVQKAVAGNASPGAKDAAAVDRREGAPPILDADTLDELAAMMAPARFTELLHRVSKDLDEGIAALQVAMRKGEHEAAAHEAHRLAGSAALVGAQALHAALASLEAACRTGDPARAEDAAQTAWTIAGDTRTVLRELAEGAR
ncbi:PAS domain-containing hybrid sensor histidine kinase/response regulator [Aurantimonas coralicida]|uniref:PAS domain-containing hybrid sensor histidine kinase/response regulator n=2 Tax=Aurantimonas coralicida TaxID=182270 RepID=UPI001D18A7CA|nr:PAS domain-containing hybrid sensor histidine kinase/response regulator [Aurantimonas coralicida]MCC4299963.1 PAS domain S-box protein [Aurantimonas coralicida]MCW7545906.1 PAS domain S-box protein [Aurantimonas litoralis]